MDSGDLATWVSGGATTVLALVALAVSLRSNRHAKDTVAASVAAANASVRSADAAERQAAAAEAALQQAPVPAPADPSLATVDFTRTYSRGGRGQTTYQLRNLGPADATNVRVDAPGWILWHTNGNLSDEFPDGLTIPAGDAITYTEAKTFGVRGLEVTTMWLTCDQLPSRLPIPIG